MTRQTIKALHDGALRGGLCAVWLIGGVLMLTNFVAYESDPYATGGTALAIRSSIYAAIAIVGILAHAYLVDRKAREKSDV